MAFMKNIIDLRGILTLMVLTIPSIAANVDCNGKPFHCVNSTHFMICVDLGSGVSSTIDDFVIPCPPTTVCQGTNRFECEFPAVTTTVAPSVAPLVTSVSETIETVTTPTYKEITSNPFEEYYNTLSTTTLSENMLTTYQTIATEPTLTESAIQLPTEVIQNIEVIIAGTESNSTLSETIPRADVALNDPTTLTHLHNNTSANVTERIPDTTENVNVTIPGSETDLTETILSITENVINEPKQIFTSDSSALPVIADTTTELIFTENTETTLSESELTYTTPSADALHNDLTELTPLPGSNGAIHTVLDSDMNGIIPEFKDNSTSTAIIQSATKYVAQNEVTPVLTSNSSALLTDTADITTEPILTEVTETIPNVSTLRETIQSIDYVQNDVITLIPLLYNESANATDLTNNTSANVTEPIPNTTENANAEVPKSDINSTLSEINLSLDVVLNNPTILLPNSISANATYLIPDVTENVNVIESESEMSPTLNETSLISKETVKSFTPLDTLRSTSMPNIVAETSSILTEVTESMPTSNDIVQHHLKTLHTSINTALPDKIADILTELPVTYMKENINSEKIDLSYLPLSKFTPSATLTDTTDATAVESTITDVTENTSFVVIEYNPNHTSSGDKSIIPNNILPVYTQSKTDLQNKTESVTNDKVLKIPTYELNITKKYNSDVTDVNSTTEVFMNPSAETTSMRYQDLPTFLTLTDISNHIVETTPNSNLETTDSAKGVSSITYGEVYYNSDTETIGNDQGLLTNQTERKPFHSEKVLSTGTIENTITTPVLAVVKDENLFTSPLVSSFTDAPVPHSPTEVTLTSTYTLAMKTESRFLKTNQESNMQIVDTRLGGETNNNELPITTSESNGTSKPFQIFNVSGSDLPLPEQMPFTKSPVYSLDSPLVETAASGDDIIARTAALDDYNLQQSINSPVDLSTLPTINITIKLPEINENIHDFRGTEQTTKASTVTETSEDIFSETLTLIPTSQLPMTEPTPSPDFLTNLNIDINAVSDPTLESLTASIRIEAVTIATTSTTTTATDSVKKLDLNITTINVDKDSVKKDVLENAASINTTADGNVATKQELPTALLSEKLNEKDDSMRVTESSTENNRIAEHKTPVYVTINKEPTILTIHSEIMNAENFVPVLYPTTEIIPTEAANNLYFETPKNILESVKNDLTQTTVSSILVDNVQSKILSVVDIIPVITPSASMVDDPGHNINSPNTAQEDTSNPIMIAPELISSAFQTEIPVHNSATMESVTKIPAMLTETLNTNILGVGNRTSSVTESSRVSAANFTVKGSNDTTVSIGAKATKENNPLINLLLNSLVEPIPYREPTVTTKWNLVSLELIPTQEDTEKQIENTFTNGVSSGGISTPVNDNVAIVSSAQQESNTESIIHFTDTYIQTSVTSNDFFSKGRRPLPTTIPDILKDSTQVTTETYTHTVDMTSQKKKAAGIEKSYQSPVDSIESRPPHQGFTTDKLLSTDASEPSQQAPNANNFRENTLDANQFIVLEQASTPTIDNLRTKPTQDLFITLGMPIRTVGLTQVQVIDTTNIDYEAPTKVENVMATNHYIFDQPIEESRPNTPISQGFSTESQTYLTKISTATIVQNNSTPKQNKVSSDTSTTVPKTESWRATVVTKPYIKATSQFITEQPVIERKSTEPRGKIPVISDITTLTVGRPNVGVVSNLEGQFINVSPDVITPSIVEDHPVIDVKTTESWNKVPRATEITVPTASLVKVASSTQEELNVLNNNDVTQTKEQHVLSTPETEFIIIPKVVATQSTRQVVTPISLDTNRDADIVIVDVVKTNVPVSKENSLLTDTHSGISVLQKQPKESENEKSEKPEWSESLDKEEIEKDFEAPEINEDVPNSVTLATDTIVANIGTLDNEQNVNKIIDLTGTPKTADSGLPLTTNKMGLKSTIEMTTAKEEENSNSGYQSINNIELISTTVKSTDNFAHAKVAIVSSDPKEKSTKNESYNNTEHIESNVTSNIKNSTDRYSPKIKSRFANIHNASVPAFESTTNSFICDQNSRGRFSDSIDCRKFYICIGKPESIEGFCPNNTVFSELRKQCTKNLSHCVRNNQFQCVSEGRFSDYLNDNIYYICVKNNVGTFIRFKLQCQSGYHLNKTSVRCALNTDASQSTSQPSRSDNSKNNSDQSESLAKSEKLVVESSKAFECKKEGRFPDANDCRKYYICTKRGNSQYRLKTKKCDSDELFHKDKKKCVDADSYECS